MTLLSIKAKSIRNVRLCAIIERTVAAVTFYSRYSKERKKHPFAYYQKVYTEYTKPLTTSIVNVLPTKNILHI